ncbi:hypothetical protein [Hyphococcus lacteus]|uniref:Uncharacterized protein n=1 Tax=Hyphococcus lacteus TaxID=3143536 RepID=A0ABV3Z3Q8_9PROT
MNSDNATPPRHEQPNFNLEIRDDRPFFDCVQGALSDILHPFLVNASIVDGQEKAALLVQPFNNGETDQPTEILAELFVIDLLDKENLERLFSIIAKHKEHASGLRSEEGAGKERGGLVCFILAESSALTLHDISREVQKLNSQFDSSLWPDAYAVYGLGVINYAAYVPGRKETGDFFLPPKGIRTKGPVPSVSIQLIMRASRTHVFAKVASLLVARCGIYDNAAGLPNFITVSSGFPAQGLSAMTYQFNLSGILAPQIFEQAIAERMPGARFNVVSGDERLASVRYLEWQDGGVFVVRGRFPIDIFLSFMQSVVPALKPEDLHFFRHDDVQASYVLPISFQQFVQTLQAFSQCSSNMAIEPDTQKHVVEKISDEGTSSPFIARMMLGIFSIRDAVFHESSRRKRFDDLYEDVLNGVNSLREACQEIRSTWETHKGRFESGEIVKISGNAIHVNESIDRSLRREFETLLNASARVIKQSTQSLLKEYGLDIGFLFKKASTFQTGINKLRLSDPLVADYLLSARSWTEPLILMRNDQLEHGKPISIKVAYSASASAPTITEPSISTERVTDFADRILNSTLNFVEDMIVYCLQRMMSDGLTVAEIPVANREKSSPERFYLTIEPGGDAPWRIQFIEAAFDDR